MKTSAILRHFAVPIFSLIAAFGAFYGLGTLLPHLFQGAHQMADVARLSYQAAPWAFFMLGAFAMVTGAIQLYAYWLWEKGEAESCHRCGGILQQKDGRYGLWRQCISCGAKR